MTATPLAGPAPAVRSAWMTLEEFCYELGISKDTAYKWSAAGPRSGKFPKCRRLPNGALRIRRDWFEDWMEGLGPDA